MQNNYLYENNEFELLSLNQNILEYIALNLNNFENFFYYLKQECKYDIIYNFEEFNEYLKTNFKQIILNVNDIDNFNNTTEELKKEFQNKFKKIEIIWI